jgi:Ca2+-binding RTX toxin-like protein
MRIALVLLASLAVPGAIAASAPAATVSVQYLRSTPGDPGSKYDDGVPAIDYFTEHVVDTDGAANRLVVDAQGRVRDGAVPLTLGEGCFADAEGWVSCAPAVPAGHLSQSVLAIDAGAGDDAVELGALQDGPDVPSLDLGPGDDRVDVVARPLDVVPAQWTVQGGPGADTITAAVTGIDGPFGLTDPVLAASWFGVIWDGGPGPDAASGGTVLVTYAGRTAGVRVTPDGAADDGEPGEGDDVGPDVPVIFGGDGPDVLTSSGGAVFGGPGDDLLLGQDGNARRELLNGGAGNDALWGGKGDDDLAGGPGDDVLVGGPGADRLDDGTGADRVMGGEGDDEVRYRADHAPDVWDGGPGTDTFADLDSRGITTMDVSLDGVADDGPGGERDDVEPNWEDVHIGAGDLTGSDGPDVLSIETDVGTVDGRDGDDRLSGGHRIVGGPGRDVLTVGGNFPPSRVDARDGEADRVECLRAPLRIRSRDRADRLFGCDHPQAVVALRPGADLALHAGGRLPLTVTCFGTWVCSGRLWLRTGARRASGQQTYSPGNQTSIRVSIPVHRPAGRRPPCGHARITARLGERRNPEHISTIDLGPCTWR